jgi:hypothetical protein
VVVIELMDDEGVRVNALAATRVAIAKRVESMMYPRLQAVRAGSMPVDSNKFEVVDRLMIDYGDTKLLMKSTSRNCLH